MWTIAVTKTSSDVGLTESELKAVPKEELAHRMRNIEERFLAAGAHYVIEQIGSAPSALEAINERLACGERP